MWAATTLFSLLLLSIGANSQSSKPASVSSAISATPSITACILACVEPAATANGCAYTNASCLCASAQFQADAALCLKQHCTANDLKNALALQTSQCRSVSVSVSRSGTASVTPHTVSFTAPSSAASTTGTLTSSVHSSASLTASASNAANSTSASPSGTNQSSAFKATRVTFGSIALVCMALII